MSLKIGFDLWGTLIKSNPLFTERKQDLFKTYFPHKSGVECEEIMRSVKHDLNQVIEDSGWQPTQSIIHKMITTRMVSNYNKVGSFMEDYQRLAIIYHPTLIEENSEILRELNKNTTLYLVSNTMFLLGETLEIILKKLGISDFFYHTYFSDEKGHSKPNIDICSSIQFDYFIGDNQKTDGVFAKEHNSQFIEIYGETNKTLKDAYNIINPK